MMRNLPSPEDGFMLHAIRDRLLVTIQFFEDAQGFPSGAQMRQLVTDAAQREDLKSLRLITREVDAMAVALAPHERDGLEAMLLARFGVDRDAERAAFRLYVASVIERGSIASEKERRRLEDYVEMLEATGGDPAEVAAVRRLMRS